MRHTARHEIDMCNGAILPKLLLFSIPLMCSSFLQLFFNAADTIVVGRYAGDNSLAAVGANISLISLLVNLFTGLSVGSNILAARQIGAGDREGLHETIHTSMLLSLFGGAVLSVLGLCNIQILLHWMQTPPAIFALSELYLRIYFLGMPAVTIYNFGAALLRAAGDTRRPFYFLFFSGMLNVLLNLVFVIRFKLDVAGVAVATIISQYVSAALVVRCLLTDTGSVRMSIRHLYIYPQRLKTILRIGVPAGLQGIFFSLSNITIQSSINSFGEIVIAGSAAASSIESFGFTTAASFQQADTAFISQNLGAGRKERIIPVLLWSTLCGAVCGMLFGLITLGFGRDLLTIYSHEETVVAAGWTRLLIVSVPYVLYAPLDTLAGSMRGLGYSILPMVVTCLGVCGFRVLWIQTVFRLPQYHFIETVYFSYPLSWVITALAHLLCFVWAMRRLEKNAPL